MINILCLHFVMSCVQVSNKQELLIVLQNKAFVSVFCLCIASLCVRFIQPLWEYGELTLASN